MQTLLEYLMQYLVEQKRIPSQMGVLMSMCHHIIEDGMKQKT